MNGDDAGRRIFDPAAFRISFLPQKRRKLQRTGVSLFSIQYWTDAFVPLIGRTAEPMAVKYDPRDLSKIWVVLEEGRVLEARYRNLNRPPISLWEYRHPRNGQRLERAIHIKAVGKPEEIL